MISRGMAVSTLHPDNPFHPDNHKMPTAYPLEYHKRDGTVELEEAAAAEAAGRPFRFIRPEVDPTWTPGVKKVKTVVEVDHTHGILSKDEVRTVER